ncbi:MAG: hypothetical protein GXY38_04535 [Planctomycetes bacterium]|jgi:beta-galactosidase GanA|nr:hypothetical protein [Planctomycetota bacterium]
MYDHASVKYPAEFVLGTQYYRQPTPLSGEWQDDIKNIRDMGMRYIQLRPHWRWHERKEGVYQWDDIDAIFNLASKIGVKVIFKFMLECGPDYLFRKYNAYRVGLKGENIWPFTLGAFYPGGWIPCFDNPHVIERMKLFIAQAVNRYKNESSLALWHAWNEPRSRPMGECTCRHSHQSYIAWLRAKFGDIEALNAKFGQCWADFDDIDVPRNTAGFFDMHLWRQWAATRVAWRVNEVAQAIRQHDPSRDVIAHVGMPSPLQDVLADTSDDWLTRKTVAFYGSSYEIRYTPKPLDKSWPFLIADWTRAISGDGYFWINELYPSRAAWQPELPPEEIAYWAWAAVAGGAKGIILWQYRKERVGSETNEAGLVEIDGGENPTTAEMRTFFGIVNDNQKLLRDAKTTPAHAAIVYDFNSDLISRIEESNHFGNQELIRKLPAGYTYKTALQGAYHLFWQAGVAVDFVSSHELERITEYKLVYLPYMVMVDESQARILADYVRAGGRLVAEGAAAMRSENTWVSPTRPGGLMADVFGVKELDRVVDEKEAKIVTLGELGDLESRFMNSTFAPKTAGVCATFSGGAAAVCANSFGLGSATITGFSAGLANLLKPDDRWAKWLLQMLSAAKVPLPPQTPGLYIRRMFTENATLAFVFNPTAGALRWSPDDDGFDLISKSTVRPDEPLEIAPSRCRIVVVKKNA